MKARAIIAIVAAMGAAGADAARADLGVTAHYPIGGEVRFDYLRVEPDARRLYVSHGDRVEVLDADTGKSVGSITGFKGLHGIAFDTNGKFGYASDGGANEVVVFDRSTWGERKVAIWSSLLKYRADRYGEAKVACVTATSLSNLRCL